MSGQSERDVSVSPARIGDRLEIEVNGEPRLVCGEQSVSDLLAELGLEPATVAIEYNGEVIPRATFGELTLRAGDRLEIVRFVQGG